MLQTYPSSFLFLNQVLQLIPFISILPLFANFRFSPNFFRPSWNRPLRTRTASRDSTLLGTGSVAVAPEMAPGAREKANGKAKLGTFQGVFIPTSLNIFSILVFLRFGFILGQSGVIGFFGKC